MKGNKIYYMVGIALSLLGAATSLQAQVTIGLDQIAARAALLDLKTQVPDANNATSKKGGLLLPRVLLVNNQTLEPFISTTETIWTNATQRNQLMKEHIGLQVYNLATTHGFTQGMYIWNGTTWKRQERADSSVAQNVNYFFTLPSFIIQLENSTNYQTVDLYAEYERQFAKTATNTKFIANPSYELDVIPKAGTERLYRRDELNYAITDFDDTVIFPHDLSISSEGILTFKLWATNPALANKTYLNVLFIVKEQE
ncbi:hypothetical protein ACKUSY_17285 [Myroides odoratus]